MSSAKPAKDRAANDFYPTPAWVTKLLLSRLEIRPTDIFLEPAAGEFDIYNLVEIDESRKKYAELTKGIDYLFTDRDLSADVIITNPPFSLFETFISTAIHRDLSPTGTLAMLLRVNALGGQLRREFWNVNRPTHMLVITPRPSFSGGGTDSSEYAWFIWDRGGRYKGAVIDGASRTEVEPDYKPKRRQIRQQGGANFVKQFSSNGVLACQ